jgi:hypothetical protein
MPTTRPVKVDKDGLVRLNISVRPEVAKLLLELSAKEERSRVKELTYLIVERARTMGLDVSGQVEQ